MEEKILWSIGFVLIVISLCLIKPNAGRIFLGIFYLIMAIAINLVNAFTDPQPTVLMGEASFIPLYRTIFSEIVSKAPVFFIMLVVLYQILVGLMILSNRQKVKIGLTGASIFLILITPFGIIQLPWLGLAAIQIYLLRYDFNESLFKWFQVIQSRGSGGN